MFAQYAAQQLQTIVNLEQDVLGFDPRGIGATTPRLDCWSPYKQNTTGDPYDFGTADVSEGLWKRLIWEISGREAGLVNSTAASLYQLNTRVKGVVELCHEKDDINKENGIFRHVTTPNVARDMISIIDAWDEWRASTKAADVAVEGANEQGYALDTKGKLVYWGFSYGVRLSLAF